MHATTTATHDPETLPRWDLDSIFPGPESPQFREALQEVTNRIADLVSLFDRHGIGSRPPGPVDAGTVAAFEEIVAAYDVALALAYRLDGYLSCLTADDSRNEAARAAESEWRALKTGLAGLAPRFTAWAGAVDRAALAAQSAVAAAHEPILRRLDITATHLMPPGEEALAAMLGPSGATAWMTLSEELLSLATAHVELDGEERTLTLSEIDNLEHHPNREVRRRGYEAGNTARRAIAIPLAAALNGVKGEQLVLSRRRGWDDPLDQALFANAIDRDILDAMFAAMRDGLPDYRRYLRAKARLLGLPVLAGYDLMAPVGEPAPWPFDVACDFVWETFAAFHPKLGSFAERAFAERWIDAGPRAGKEGGGFCTGVGGDASRILLNYAPVASWMSTIAHELGHAYHNFTYEALGRTFLRAPPDYGPGEGSPMVLAETASTLCEILVLRAAVDSGDRAEQAIAHLDAWLQSFTLSIFGIMPLFAFEQTVFATRAQRDLSPAEYEALMAGAWHDIAGNAIDPETVWSMSWTMGHFIGDAVWYYNFPYAFGMLFALGLLAAHEAEPAGFLDRFDTLLADSGMRDARELAAGFGIDLADPAFWHAGFEAFRADVDRYETFAEGDRVMG
jgi:pepF/M3 family oligoendopeptidase